MSLYEFKDKMLLRRAFTHRSSDQECNYEKLEWLGDAVLKAVQSEWLLREHPSKELGALNSIRERVQSNQYFASMCETLGWVGRIKCQKHLSPTVKISADIFEAVFGAVRANHELIL